MTLASKFVGMNIKKLSDALSSASTITAAIEITDPKDASRAVDLMRKSVINGKGSILIVAIRI